MPRIDYAQMLDWQNYHGSVRMPVVTRHGTYRRDGGRATDGPAAFAESAAVLRGHVAEAMAHAAPTGVLGATWSWSDIVGAPALQLDTAELDAIFAAEPADMHMDSSLAADHCAFVGGGALLSQLVGWAENRQLSIKACGSYLGQSVAGASATSVNGSTLGYGGFQNQICGLHLVVGPSKSIWVEQASCPALADATALRFADSVIRDNAIFADCLVHLGGMGLVNGVLFKLVDKAPFVAVRIKRAIDPQWLGRLERGEFDDVASDFGLNGDLVYYEVQIDPFDYLGKVALHTFYFRTDAPTASAVPGTPIPTVFDGLASIFGDERKTGNDPEIPEDIFDYYAHFKFHETPTNAPEVTQSWGELHAAQPDPQTRQLIYSAALAIDRSRLTDALAAMRAQLQAMLSSGPADARKRHMIYTLRFVSGAAGSMAFTRYPLSVVIDLEGLVISKSSIRAAIESCAALGAVNIGFCHHWGKYMPGGTGWIAKEFGSANPANPLDGWQATRKALLDPAAAAMFTNRALGAWGIV